tara:strand:- start:7799 stop:8488 length:690 start_codon:yes stop_codon:yes gene_type:complete
MSKPNRFITFLGTCCFIFASPISLADPLKGSLYDYALGQQLQEVEEDQFFWNGLGMKSAKIDKKTFDTHESVINVQITPSSNLIYNIESVSIFPTTKMAKIFFDQYAAYFRTKYRGNLDYENSYAIGWHSANYKFDEQFELSLTMFSNQEPGTYWKERLGDDYFNNLRVTPPSIERINGAKLQTGFNQVIIGLNYHPRNKEGNKLKEARMAELDEIIQDQLKHEGIVEP